MEENRALIVVGLKDKEAAEKILGNLLESRPDLKGLQLVTVDEAPEKPASPQECLSEMVQAFESIDHSPILDRPTDGVWEHVPFWKNLERKGGKKRKKRWGY